eukprot:COSAG01_NODE_494_length_16322_cov_35.380879_13_plen_67_part_00
MYMVVNFCRTQYNHFVHGMPPVSLLEPRLEHEPEPELVVPELQSQPELPRHQAGVATHIINKITIM